ncbi:Uncharacterised protein [Sphingobacterium daejeonense]|nr:Uncharacterised protein [Sphingobacterium daejeonense]
MLELPFSYKWTIKLNSHNAKNTIFVTNTSYGFSTRKKTFRSAFP